MLSDALLHFSQLFLPQSVEMMHRTMSVADIVAGTGFDGRRYIVLGGACGVVEAHALGKRGRERRRQGAARAVGIDRVEAVRLQFGRLAGLGIIEYIDKFAVVQVSRLEEHRHPAAALRQLTGGGW